MPLTFPRAPQSVFSQQRHTQTQPSTAEHKVDEPQHIHDFFRFYPLEVDKPTHGTKPVAPLPHSRGNPTRPQQQMSQQRQMPQQQRQMPTRPQHTPQPPTQPVQNLQPTPELAAEQFRRVNKNLPDGVMYEPIDDDIMRLLKENGHIKNAPAQGTPQPIASAAPSVAPATPLAPMPASPSLSKITTTLESLAQDEHNAKIFYTNLSLSNLANACEVRLNQYVQILKSHFDRDFTPQDKELHTNIPFAEAITLAITEENKALVTLGGLLDQVEGTIVERLIERVINKKLIGHQLLMSHVVASSTQ